MTLRTYRVECWSKQTCTWFIVVGDLFEHDANRYAADYRRQYPELTFRVCGRL